MFDYRPGSLDMQRLGTARGVAQGIEVFVVKDPLLIFMMLRDSLRNWPGPGVPGWLPDFWGIDRLQNDDRLTKLLHFLCRCLMQARFTCLFVLDHRQNS